MLKLVNLFVNMSHLHFNSKFFFVRVVKSRMKYDIKIYQRP